MQAGAAELGVSTDQAVAAVVSPHDRNGGTSKLLCTG